MKNSPDTSDASLKDDETGKVPGPMMQVKGEHHVITATNSAFCSLLGRSSDDLLGRRVAEVFPGDEDLIARLDEVFRTGKVLRHEKDTHPVDDPQYWSYTCLPWIIESPKPVGVTVQVTGMASFMERARKINEAFLLGSLRQHEISTEVAQRNDLLNAQIQERDRMDAVRKENERQFRTLANSIPHLAWMAHPDGRIFWYNQRWSVFTETKGGTPTEQDWSAIIHPEDLPRVMKTMTTSFQSGKPWEDTFRLRRHDGEMVWHLSRMKAICDNDGTVLRWFGTHTDITSERLLEENLRDHAEEMEKIDKRKSEFLATLAHELRNPLAPLRNGLEMLEISGEDDVREKIQAMMRRQVDQMVLLVDDLMDLNRISHGGIELRMERLDVRAMIDRAVESTGALIEKQGHSLMLDMPVRPTMVVADGMRLVQIFSNLLNNAAKYTDNGGRITVQVKAGLENVSIAVQDNGIGLAADQLNKVFDMFAQVERGTDRVQGGLGIGLNIVKQLVEMQKGSIEVHSDGPGMGSAFTVHLPLAEPLAEVPIPTKTSGASTPSIEKRRILVVDDNADAASVMAWMLDKLGHVVQKANNGREALVKGEEFKPEIVIMDIGMPLMNGHEACKLMRNTDWGKAAHIVALTGLGAEQDREKSNEAGFDHHLVKPVGRDALLDLIASATMK